MQNFNVSRCLVTEEIAEQIKSEPRAQNPHRQLYIIRDDKMAEQKKNANACNKSFVQYKIFPRN